MSILILAEHQHTELNSATLFAVNAASKLNLPITLLVAGFECAQVAEQAAKLKDVKKVLIADAKCYQHQLAENVSQLLVELAQNYTHILAPATTFGKNILPRAAALLDVAVISDVIEIQSQDTFVRPMYAGNVLATVQSHDRIKLLTIRPTAFNKAETNDNMAAIERLSINFDNQQVAFLDFKQSVSERPDLANADIIIAGGRGLQSREQFKQLTQIADRLHAAIGASRAAVDAGFVSNDYQVGQTGKIVAPKLYIAVGISGAIQHLAGIKDSKVIVAINKDPNAAIFQQADYGLVGDLFVLLPELEKELEKLGY